MAPDSVDSNVDFPAPFGPIIATSSSFAILIEISFKIFDDPISNVRFFALSISNGPLIDCVLEATERMDLQHNLLRFQLVIQLVTQQI